MTGMRRWLPNSLRTPRACVFCEKDTFTKNNRIIYEDEQVIAIEDINPRAKRHLLVISKTHIRSVDELTAEHASLLSHMIETGRGMLAKDGYTNPDEYQLGFHKPPFTSVPHLHLHCLGFPFVPAWNRLRFTPSVLNSYVDAQGVLKSLNSTIGGKLTQ